MTSDDVTLDISLPYTYRGVHPERFALEVDNPEQIVFEFVQGKLRDVVNTKAMTEVMVALQETEAQRSALTSEAHQEAIRAVLDELEAGGDLAEAYIQVLLAQELKENSKWIISGGETAPVVKLREAPNQTRGVSWGTKRRRSVSSGGGWR